MKPASYECEIGLELYVLRFEDIRRVAAGSNQQQLRWIDPVLHSPLWTSIGCKGIAFGLHESYCG